MSTSTVTYDDIQAAHERLNGVAHKTAVLTSATADEMVGAHLFFKCENQQRMGAFKFRGAYNAISQLDPAQKRAGVIAFSSGNHAQAIALASRLLDVHAVIVMPNDAPEIKVQATKGYGGEVVRYDRYTEDREAIASNLAAERGLTLIPPYDHPGVIAGQGTVARELFDEVGSLDMLVTPLGGGGLLSGCSIAANAINPECDVVGVEPAAGDDGLRSLRDGRIVHIDTPRTIADGAQTQHLGQITFPVIQQQVSRIVTATDAELVETMKFFAGRMKLVVEPTGCLAAAAVFGQKIDVRGKRVGIVLSGGNVDLERFAHLILEGVDG